MQFSTELNTSGTSTNNDLCESQLERYKREQVVFDHVQKTVNLFLFLPRESGSFNACNIHQSLQTSLISASNSQSMNCRCIYHTIDC